MSTDLKQSCVVRGNHGNLPYCKTFWSTAPIKGVLLQLMVCAVTSRSSFCTFRFIERPAMQSTHAVTAWLRSRLTLRPKGRAASGTPPELAQ